MTKEEKAKQKMIQKCKDGSKQLIKYIKMTAEKLDSASEMQSHIAMGELLFLMEFAINDPFRLSLLNDYLHTMQEYIELAGLNTENMKEH